MMNFRTIARFLAFPSVLAAAQSIRGGVNEIDSSYDGISTLSRDTPESPPSRYDVHQPTRGDSRIIGGSQAASGRFRYSASLQDRIGHFCGGTLIAADTVLSAA